MEALPSAITTEGVKNLTYPVPGSDDAQAYLTSEPTEGSLGLIMIQEIWGLNTSITGAADRWAAAGNFVVLVPDLYKGKVAKSREDTKHFKQTYSWDKAIPDINGAIIYLKSKGCKKVGVVGFCMGGALTIASAANLPDQVDAAVAFYGVPDLSKNDVSKIKCPIKAIFGEKDEIKGFSDVTARENLEEALKKGGVKEYEIKVYENATHAFMNPDRATVYNPEAAKAALEDAVAFFKAKLV